jgi:hypothetical protein
MEFSSGWSTAKAIYYKNQLILDQKLLTWSYEKAHEGLIPILEEHRLIHWLLLLHLDGELDRNVTWQEILRKD